MLHKYFFFHANLKITLSYQLIFIYAKKIDTVKKLGSYLHSYGSPIDVEILTFPLIKAKEYFFFKYRLVKWSVLQRRIRIFKDFWKKLQIGWVKTKNVLTFTPKMAFLVITQSFFYIFSKNQVTNNPDVKKGSKS